MKVIILITCIYLNIGIILCESECKNFKTCGGCIGYAYDTCVWCSAAEHEGRRCQSKTEADANRGWCKEPVYDPHVTINEIENRKFSPGINNTGVVQFAPQKLKIKARPGVPIPINMSYKPAKDYPLDVYYLMDYSYTMRTYASVLRDQGLEIYKQLTSLTNNVRLGIGSFVEKPAMPFADVHKGISYSFKNHISLTENTKLFLDALKHGPNGTNYDTPEDSFDALMQVMVCPKQIGWRSGARRIIVVCSDSTYHSAGDGKFVGAIRPHTMECYMDSKGKDMSLVYDYPSVSQINKVATETNTKIIFAVDSKAKRHYEALEKSIQGSKYVPFNANTDVVDMIKNEYLELVRTLSIDSNLPSFMELKLDPDCSQKDNCRVRHEQPVNIKGTLKIKTCPTDKEMKYLLSIGPVSLDEKLEIEVETQCQCDCEKHGEEDSAKCSNAGIYQCGICDCKGKRYGSTCSCVGASSETNDLDLCKANITDLNFCSGRGICRCGKCECQSGFSGDYCEFDDNACPRPGNLLCAGNGKCKFGRCECNPHWIGDDCQCPDNNRSCIAPISNEECSGKGTCKCGVCICEQKEDTNEICSGRFCDDCDELNQKRCKELEDYAYCNYNFNKTECDERYDQTSTGVTFVNKTEIDTLEHQHKAKWCRKALDDDSFLIFIYYYPPSSTNTLEIMIQKELELPIKADVWVTVVSTIAAVLLIGLLTLLVWKYLADLHDEREYQKFERALAAGVDEDNPHYQPPAVNFTNPAYNPNCARS
ncbi:integrin beta-PS-like [Colias croceus]|uniref:integrin beta-PS-like n=1 Tax=Colias crocea TaxID=72248 RepID=UPI001E27E406|nr:integrin beta-PS-like [Colias croceus]